jgi:hypothetical protein
MTAGWDGRRVLVAVRLGNLPGAAACPAEAPAALTQLRSRQRSRARSARTAPGANLANGGCAIEHRPMLAKGERFVEGDTPADPRSTLVDRWTGTNP